MLIPNRSANFCTINRFSILSISVNFEISIVVYIQRWGRRLKVIERLHFTPATSSLRYKLVKSIQKWRHLKAKLLFKSFLHFRSVQSLLRRGGVHKIHYSNNKQGWIIHRSGKSVCNRCKVQIVLLQIVQCTMYILKLGG